MFAIRGMVRVARRILDSSILALVWTLGAFRGGGAVRHRKNRPGLVETTTRKLLFGVKNAPTSAD